MIRKLHLPLLLALALAIPAAANAATIVLTYSGKLANEGAPGAPWDASSFTMEVTWDSTATRIGTDTHIDQFAVTGTFTVQGQTRALNQVAWERAASGGDEFLFFAPGGVRLQVQVARGFTGAQSPTNTLTPFVESDVTSDVLFGGTSVYAVRRRSVSYTVQTDTDPTTSVPEPGSLVLLGAGVLGLVARRRS